jgi:ribose transport system permease protein
MNTTSTANGFSLRDMLLRFGFLIVFAAFFAFFAMWNPVFVQGQNLLNIVQNSSILLILALGMTCHWRY